MVWGLPSRPGFSFAPTDRRTLHARTTTDLPADQHRGYLANLDAQADKYLVANATESLAPDHNARIVRNAKADRSTNADVRDLAVTDSDVAQLAFRDADLGVALMTWAVFFDRYGISLGTIIIVALLTQGRTIAAFFRGRFAAHEAKELAGAEIESAAWKRILGNGARAAAYVDRLLLQQEHHLAAMRERDQYIEKFISAAVEVMRECLEITQRILVGRKEHDAAVLDQLGNVGRVLQELVFALRKEGNLPPVETL